MNDLPASHEEGFRRACADHKYAYFGPNILTTSLSPSLSCRLVPLPDTSYKDQWAFIISKNSSYKGLINWRWDNKIKTIRYITDNSSISWVPFQSLKTEGHGCVLLVIRNLTAEMYECFYIFLISIICCCMSQYIWNWKFFVIGNRWIMECSATAVNISGNTKDEIISSLLTTQ
jgi:hypothetical protein